MGPAKELAEVFAGCAKKFAEECAGVGVVVGLAEEFAAGAWG